MEISTRESLGEGGGGRVGKIWRRCSLTVLAALLKFSACHTFWHVAWIQRPHFNHSLADVSSHHFLHPYPSPYSSSPCPFPRRVCHPHLYKPIPALLQIRSPPRIFFSTNSVHPTEIIPLDHTVLPILVSRLKVLR